MLSTRSLLALATSAACSLAACGSTTSSTNIARPLASAVAQVARSHHRSPLENAVETAKRTYADEVIGSKVHSELARIAHDRTLLSALSRGDTAGAQEEADGQLRIALNHTAHVTRITVLRGSHALANATINADGVFVVAPASRALTVNGRNVGTLLVSIQDVTGFVKLVHDLTGFDVLARGASGRVRTNLAAATGAHLPRSGTTTIAGSRYFVQSFHETCWGNEASAHEALTVWVLERA